MEEHVDVLLRNRTARHDRQHQRVARRERKRITTYSRRVKSELQSKCRSETSTCNKYGCIHTVAWEACMDLHPCDIRLRCTRIEIHFDAEFLISMDHPWKRLSSGGLC